MMRKIWSVGVWVMCGVGMMGVTWGQAQECSNSNTLSYPACPVAFPNCKVIPPDTVGTCVECLNDNHCVSKALNKICSTQTNNCVVCDGQRGCPEGDVCTNGVCAKPPASEPTSTSCTGPKKKAKTTKTCKEEYGPQYKEEGGCCVTVCDRTITRTEVDHGETCSSLYPNHTMDDRGCCVETTTTSTNTTAGACGFAPAIISSWNSISVQGIAVRDVYDIENCCLKRTLTDQERAGISSLKSDSAYSQYGADIDKVLSAPLCVNCDNPELCPTVGECLSRHGKQVCCALDRFKFGVECNCLEYTRYTECVDSPQWNINSNTDLSSQLSSKTCKTCSPGYNYEDGFCKAFDEEDEDVTIMPWCPNQITTTGPACSKGALTDAQITSGTKCCEGYKKMHKEPSGYECKACGSVGVCCGIELNTVVPFIGDCIQFQKASNDPNTTVVGPTTAFPVLMKGMSRLLVTAILIFSFLLLVVAGVMMTMGGANEQAYSQGTGLIKKVIIGIALLGASGVILKLINPNFFG